MNRDIEIARAATLTPIATLAKERLGIDADDLSPHGHYIAKLSTRLVSELAQAPRGKIVLVTAISPTPAGEGKTTTSVGLCDGLNAIGKRAIVALREPSMGPVFGVKGGAAGGGRAQVAPMEDINLHFTGDFAAIALAHNLLSAMIDNRIHHHGGGDAPDARRVSWRRVMDMNDRALRRLVGGLGGAANGFAREDGFDIVAASEVMAILCLADSLADLKARLGGVVVGKSRAGAMLRGADINAAGAMAALLRDALRPNLAQTLENNPALIHGGPFANIAHGCNSVAATRAARGLADYVVTEAGFGADLGAEKFINIKCRKAGFAPAAAVLVATVRALKYHGGAARDALAAEDLAALDRGLENLRRHIRNIREHYGMECVVAVNHFSADSDAEVKAVLAAARDAGVDAFICRHWENGGRGAAELAEAVAALADSADGDAPPRLLYDDDAPLKDKIDAVARRIYGAGEVSFAPAAAAALDEWQADYGALPVCLAKTQYSFTTDPTRRGLPADGHVLQVTEARLAAGAGFVVAVCGGMMTMPGLPKTPAAEMIDISADGEISGLF